MVRWCAPVSNGWAGATAIRQATVGGEARVCVVGGAAACWPSAERWTTASTTPDHWMWSCPEHQGEELDRTIVVPPSEDGGLQLLVTLTAAPRQGCHESWAGLPFGARPSSSLRTRAARRQHRGRGCRCSNPAWHVRNASVQAVVYKSRIGIVPALCLSLELVRHACRKPGHGSLMQHSCGLAGSAQVRRRGVAFPARPSGAWTANCIWRNR